MFVKRTRNTRVLLGRLVGGEDVVSALAEVARAERVDAALVRGHGVVEDVELARFDPDVRTFAPAFRGRGALELASLAGTVALRDGRPDLVLRAVVARGDRGEVAGGVLVRARAVAVEFVLDAYDDAEVPRRDDPETGLAVWDP